MRGLFDSPNYVVRMHVDVTCVVFFFLMNNNLGTLYLGCEVTELTRSLILIGSKTAVTLRHYVVYFEPQPYDFQGKICNRLNSFDFLDRRCPPHS